MTKLTPEVWKSEFEAELQRRTRLTWADACGDESVLQSYYESGETPVEMVLWYIDKYNLEDYSLTLWQ